MNRNYITTLSLIALLLCGCSKQKQLSQLLFAADHVVATNHNGQTFSCTVSGGEVNKLAEAVASAKIPHGLKALDFRNPFNWDVAFYAGTGTNSLAVMHLLNHGFFELDGVQYCDGTGVAEAFWKKLEETRTR